MKLRNKIKMVFICLMVVATYDPLLAQESTIQISWTLPANPPPDMKGIKINHNGALIQLLPATATGWTGQTVIPEGENVFDVIMYDEKDQESEPASVIKEVNFPPPPVTDVIVIIR